MLCLKAHPKSSFIADNNKTTRTLSIVELAGSGSAKVRILFESPKPFVKKWSCSQLFIGFLISIWEEMCTFAAGY